MSIILELLEEISTVGGLMPSYKAYRGNFKYKPVTYYQSLNRLQKKKLVRKKKNKSGQVIFVITDKGQKLLHNPSLKVARTDGYSTIVTFDIPEDKKRERNIFRRYLIRNKYTLIQKSMLISPYETNEELLDLIKELKIQSFVKIISGRIEHII